MNEKKRASLAVSIMAGDISVAAVVSIVMTIANLVMNSSGAKASVFLLVNLAIVVVSVIISTLLAKGITDKLSATIGAVCTRMASFAKGDISSPMPDVEATSAELFALKSYMISIIDNTSSVISDVDYMLGNMADGNFSVDTKARESYVGEYSNILSSEETIKNKLSHTLTEIIAISEQVSTGSVQVSNSAQTLAQGATEQASSVEELSSTINEVARQIGESAA